MRRTLLLQKFAIISNEQGPYRFYEKHIAI